jgi:hypothetical protein
VHRRKFSNHGKLSTDRKTLFYEPLATHTMVLEDTLSGRELLRIPQPDTWSGEYALAPDSQTLVTTTSRDQGGTTRYDRNAFRFWERASGKECLTIRVVQSGPGFLNRGLWFSADGRLLASLRDDRLLQVWDAARGQELWHCQGPAEATRVMLFAPDGKSLITGHDDGTILVWKLPADVGQRRHPKRTSNAEELENWWAALAGADAYKAYEAIWSLVAAAEDAVGFLAPRLKPAESITARSLRQALADLDSDRFAVRQAAEKRLAGWQGRAGPALRDALKKKPSLDKRRRIDRILATPPAVVTSPGVLRHLRAVRVLEHVAASGSDGTRSANAAPRLAAIGLLKKLASGDPEARLTKEVTAALGRLQTQRDPYWTPSR